MSSNLHTYILLLSFSVFAFPLFAESDNSEAQDTVDWAAILEEAESSADWAADPLADLGLFGESASIFLTASAKAGAGYSSNFLKRPEAVSSRYYNLEADAWLNWFLDDSTVTALFFIESNIYENKVDVDDELLTFGQIGWSIPKGSTELGVEVLSFYADQIYDASLLISGSEPEGTRIKQFRPEASVYIDWYPGKRDRLRMEISALRAEFNIENQDYWEPVLRGEWEHLWSKPLVTLSKVEISRQFYDDEVGRMASGITFPEEERLLVDRLFLEQRLTWKPTRWDWFEASASLGISWDSDQTGDYESMQRSWASARTKFSGKWGQVRLTGRWMEIRYEERLPFTLHTQRSFNAEYKLPLPWDFAVYLRGEWTDLNSSIESNRYTEQRGEFLFEWSY